MLMTRRVVKMLEFVWNGATRQIRVISASGFFEFRKHPQPASTTPGQPASQSWFEERIGWIWQRVTQEVGVQMRSSGIT